MPRTNSATYTLRNMALFILAMLYGVLGLVSNSYCAEIIAFGDSITAGHSSNSGGYPPKLKNLLDVNGVPSRVVNQGRSGEKTSEGASRINAALASLPGAEFILIMEGTNDIRGGLSVQTTKHNLQVMINKSVAAGVTPILATLTPSNRAGSSKSIPNIWNPMIISLAAANGVTLCDQYSAILPTWGSSNADGLHPNDKGYITIAQTWYSCISGQLDGGNSDGGGGCFIATAAFGSPFDKQVTLLKKFRDQFLLTNTPGKKFVEAYYYYSPPAAEFIRQNDWLRKIVRFMLYPLVAMSYLLLEVALPIQLVMVVIFCGIAGRSIYGFGRRWMN